MSLFCHYYGLTAYEEAFEEQLNQVQVCLNQKDLMTHLSPKARLLGFEHPKVITRGRRSVEMWLPPHLKDVTQIITDRGGELALHQPGQLIIYPIFNLRNAQVTVKNWIQLLHEVSQRTLLELGVQTYQKNEAPGLWTDKGKIMFIGIRINQGVSYHGLAINIKNDLSDYQGFNACGNPSIAVDQVGGSISLKDVFDLWCEFFKKRQEFNT